MRPDFSAARFRRFGGWSRRARLIAILAIILSASSGAFAASTPYTGTPTPVPGQINAEVFDNGGEGVAYHDSGPNNVGGQVRSTGVDIETSGDGGYDIGWVAANEWLNYTIGVATSGSYTVQLRVASPSGASMHLGFNGNSPSWTTISIPATGGWQNWTTVTLPVTLSAGTQLMTLLFDTGGLNYRYANITSAGAPPPPPSGTGAYSGSPVVLPGIVQAENFDNGGEGSAYHDASSGNNGGAYRSTDVDIEAASEGGYDVGWTSGGEWLNYTVNVSAAGSYTVGLRIASPGGSAVHVGFNSPSSVWSATSLPATGGWQNWTTVNVPVTLAAGVQKLTLYFDSGGANLNWISVTPSSVAPPPPPPPPPPPSGTTLSVATWNIQINDGSETHARVAMDNLMAIGPRPEVVVIQEAYAGLFNVYIDELQRQTGKTWHGVFATHCQVGNWTGSSCGTAWYQGIGIFTTYNIVDSGSTLFAFPDCWTSARAGLRAAVNVNGTVVQVFTTHLQTGGCANDAQSRYNSISLLKSWASGYSVPQIVAGDFNADPDQIDTTSGMSPNFVDTWSVVGSGRGFTSFGPSPTMKIDYWFTDASGRAQPNSSQVYYGSGSVSDHYPVQTTFVIR